MGIFAPSKIANARSPTLTFGQRMEQFYARKRHRAVGKETGFTTYPHAIQQYTEATSVSIGAKNLVFFQVVGESHWCYLVFCPLLQFIITFLALMSL